MDQTLTLKGQEYKLLEDSKKWAYISPLFIYFNVCNILFKNNIKSIYTVNIYISKSSKKSDHISYQLIDIVYKEIFYKKSIKKRKFINI